MNSSFAGYKIAYTISLIILSLFLHPKSAYSQQNIDSLQQELTIVTNDSLRVVIMMQLSREMHRSSPQGDQDILMATMAMEAAALQDTLLYARSLDNLGLLYRFYQQYDEAINFHSRAYEMI